MLVGTPGLGENRPVEGEVPGERWSLTVGSFGLGLVVAGLIVFLGQVMEAVSTGRWSASTLRTLMQDPTVQPLVPFAFGAWLDRPGSWHAIHGVVRWLFEVVPLAFVLGGAGLLMTWKAMRLDRSRSGE